VEVADERAAVVAEVCRAVSDPPAVVLISGGVGMGKSWLVERVLAQVRGPRVVVGCRALPDGPYVLVRELVGALVEAGGDPEAADRALAGEVEYEVCRAVRDLVRDIVVVVEDVECADRRSAAVLRYLAARPPDGVAIVLTFRPPLGGRLSTMATTRVQRVELGPLTESDVDASTVALTGGIPLFVTAVLESDDPVPQVVREVADERLDGLPVATRQVLAAAAVVGGQVAVPLLARVCRLAPARVEAALLRAVDVGLMSHGGMFEFTPPIMGLALVERMSAVDRVRTHAAVVRRWRTWKATRRWASWYGTAGLPGTSPPPLATPNEPWTPATRKPSSCCVACWTSPRCPGRRGRRSPVGWAGWP